MNLTTSLLLLADHYCAASGLSKARVATIIFNDGKKFRLIEDGGDIGTKVFEKAVRWFAQNWPADTPWPAGVERPEPSSSDLRPTAATPAEGEAA